MRRLTVINAAGGQLIYDLGCILGSFTVFLRAPFDLFFRSWVAQFSLWSSQTGGVRRIRTCISMTPNSGTYPGQNWPQSDRAALWVGLKFCLEQRWRS